MKTFTRIVYVLFGTLAVVAGAAVLVSPGLALPPELYSPIASHLIREQSAGFVFIGLMFFWCAFHFDERRLVHLALLLFTVLFAAIHWTDYLREQRDALGPLLTTVPVLVLAATAPFARAAASEQRSHKLP